MKYRNWELMKKFNRAYFRLKYTYVKMTVLTLFCCTLFAKGYNPLEQTGENYFHVKLNGTEIGTTGDASLAEDLLLAARKNIASQNEELTFMEAELSVEGEEVLWGTVDSKETLLSNMEEVLRGSIRETMHRSYTVKVNEYMVSLADMGEVRTLLQSAIDKYDSEGKFRVELVQDLTREFNVLTVNVSEEELAEESAQEQSYTEAGIQTVLSHMGENAETGLEKDFDDFDLGLLSMDFAQEVEVVEAYLPESQLANLQETIEYVTKDQEKPGEYEVVSGDTLSEISLKVNIPMDRIIEMNETLENENSTIRVGDKLIITVPEPEISIKRVEQNYSEEIYDADIIYVDENSWFTNQTEVLQQPSAGFRKAVADVTYLNDKVISREILKEEIVKEAVPKIVKRGTKIPPTYIKPISGGRQTSAFGPRKAPKKGASTYHKGVDWAIPTGTAVFASCGGTVAKAGWGSGYGYVVYINHIDGRQTRYGHLSKVLVKAGQKVKQGERIALSGNTGVSTGPHLHFEILINGKQVNPIPRLNH